MLCCAEAEITKSGWSLRKHAAKAQKEPLARVDRADITAHALSRLPRGGNPPFATKMAGLSPSLAIALASRLTTCASPPVARVGAKNRTILPFRPSAGAMAVTAEPPDLPLRVTSCPLLMGRIEKRLGGRPSGRQPTGQSLTGPRSALNPKRPLAASRTGQMPRNKLRRRRTQLSNPLHVAFG
jgi:hypothetical protein